MQIIDKIKTQSPEKVAIISGDKSFSYHEMYVEILKFRSLFIKKSLVKNDLIHIVGDYSLKSIAAIVAAIDFGANFTVELPTSLNNSSLISDLKPTFKIENNKLSKTNNEKSIFSDRTGLCIFLTSGSTGTPKAIVHEQRNLLNKHLSNFTKPYITIGFLTLDHMGGFNTLLNVLTSGSTLVVTDVRRPHEIFKLVALHRVSILSTTPTFLKLTLASEAHRNHDCSSLEKITYGTEVMYQSVLDKLLEEFPRVQFKQTYGLTEVGVLPTLSESNTSLFFKLKSDLIETKIIDDILFIKCGSSMTDIVKFDSGCSPKIESQKSEWFCTGDRVLQKGDFIKVIGRQSELINIGGEKIYPTEIENIVFELSFVKNVLAFGVPHNLLGNIVGLKIVLEENSQEKDMSRHQLRQEIWNFCKDKLPKFALPAYVEIVDAIPVSARIKTQRL